MNTWPAFRSMSMVHKRPIQKRVVGQQGADERKMLEEQKIDEFQKLGLHCA